MSNEIEKYCSFCDKNKSEIRCLISKNDLPDSPAICNECVAVCLRALADDIDKRLTPEVNEND